MKGPGETALRSHLPGRKPRDRKPGVPSWGAGQREGGQWCGHCERPQCPLADLDWGPVGPLEEERATIVGEIQGDSLGSPGQRPRGWHMAQVCVWGVRSDRRGRKQCDLPNRELGRA